MTQFRRVTDQLSVSPQISVDDVQAAADQGFRLIINNRPDGEEAGQPAGREIEAAATAAGLAYVHIPVMGGPSVGVVTPEVAGPVGTDPRVVTGSFESLHAAAMSASSATSAPIFRARLVGPRRLGAPRRLVVLTSVLRVAGRAAVRCS